MSVLVGLTRRSEGLGDLGVSPGRTGLDSRMSRIGPKSGHHEAHRLGSVDAAQSSARRLHLGFDRVGRDASLQSDLLVGVVPRRDQQHVALDLGQSKKRLLHLGRTQHESATQHNVMIVPPYDFYRRLRGESANSSMT